MAPSMAPAPTNRWISSMKRIILPSESFISFKTAFNLSSNSPRYLAPAIRAPISRDHIVFPFRLFGTSPLIIRVASPSIMAVLPTPGTPTKTGLFLVFLDSILVILRISSSRPIMGSIFPSLASLVISRPYFSRTFCKFSSNGF